jgi:long-subunit acyl-CoA synthetase (AMP-forming)
LPAGTAKVTYTSGTTGAPKGVCLSRAHIETVAHSLLEATGANADDRHLCLTPLSTLLENIGGVHVPLLAGACSFVLPLAEVGLSGASGLHVQTMMRALSTSQATSAILAPQMLAALVSAIESGIPTPTNLRFLAVGGAPVSRRLLERANAIGLPVFEGYGLSECASVVTLNAPGAHRPGSQGRPLPHQPVSISSDGEVLVSGLVFLGYLGHAQITTPWPTGDLGYLDDDGFLHLRGRRKDQFITSFGRNVAPDWVEGELTAHPAIAQAAVFGEARPFNVAVLTTTPGASDEAIGLAIADTNARLPDYARIAQWFTGTEPFGVANGQLTTNGRIRRAAIHAAYQSKIESFYQEEMNDVF